VATFSLLPADHVAYSCGIEEYDREGRILRTDFGDWTLLNCYFPSGTTGEERQAFKMVFLDKFFDFALRLREERPNLIIVGDYNIAHKEIDIHDPKGNKKSSGFLPEERAWMSKWLENGFTDAFRHKNPELAEYSWWTFRAGARSKNKGWRIDYQSVSDPLKDKIISVNQLTSVTHSDHCPVKMVIDL
jgi:exodeoxyribonuclease-3